MKLKIENDCIKIKKTKYEEMIKQHEGDINQCIKYCLEEEKINTTNTIEIYIKYTNNEEIKSINNEFRSIDRETDVLSFPMYEKDELNDLCDSSINIKTLGDIIISVQKVELQAKEYGHSFQRELVYLIVHAMFHLLGYDHIDENDKIEMRRKEEKIMELLEISR